MWYIQILTIVFNFFWSIIKITSMKKKMFFCVSNKKKCFFYVSMQQPKKKTFWAEVSKTQRIVDQWKIDVQHSKRKRKTINDNVHVLSFEHGNLWFWDYDSFWVAEWDGKYYKHVFNPCDVVFFSRCFWITP